MNECIKILLNMIFYIPFTLEIVVTLIIISANDPTWFEGWFFVFIFAAYIFRYIFYSLIGCPEIVMKRGKYTTEQRSLF